MVQAISFSIDTTEDDMIILEGDILEGKGGEIDWSKDVDASDELGLYLASLVNDVLCG